MPINDMTLSKLSALSTDERRAWIESTEHSSQCSAHSDGLSCCLESLIYDD